MKRAMAALWTIVAMLLLMVILADLSNNEMIEKFRNGIYEQNPFGMLGFTEPYINHYNRGNIFYSLGDLDRAREEYGKALKSDPDEPMDCMIRVNLALSLVKGIDVKNINDDNLGDVLEILDEARDILCENECAVRDATEGGHYRDAQTLKNEIDEFEQSLLNPPEDSDDEPQDTPSPTPTPDAGSGESTPTPTPDSGDPGDGTPTPTPEDGGSGDGTPTPTPGEEGDETGDSGGEGQGATPTPTMTPEEQIMDIQNQGQQERYEGSNGTPDDYGHWNPGTYTPW